MTNVPTNFRDAIAEVYKLFDVNFTMEGTEDDWKQFWDNANRLIQKYGDDIPLLRLIEAYAGIIQSHLLEAKTGNKSLVWVKDEDYPHPRDKSEI